MSKHLFVCGTLLPELTSLLPAHLKTLIERLRPVGAATVPGRLYDLGEYPGAIVDPDARTQIHGYVLELPALPEEDNDAEASFWQRLDEYEGFDSRAGERNLFLRQRCTATLADGRPLECWLYSSNQAVSEMQRIPGGDYLKHRAFTRPLQ